MSSAKVAILGAGPAGLLAAHAAEQMGLGVQIFGIREKSVLGGAQYIHHAIPGATPEEPEAHITYKFRGSAKGYATKVYGKPIKTSWKRYKGEVPAWNMGKCYEGLWDRFYDSIYDTEIRGPLMQQLLDDDGFQLIFSTINPLGFCQHSNEDGEGLHRFQWQQIRIYRHFPLEEETDDNVIIYSGDEDDVWHRCSRLFGDPDCEVPSGTTIRGAGKPLLIRKPLETNCDCYEDEKLVKIGRFGEFKRELLVTDAYDKTCEVLNEVF